VSFNGNDDLEKKRRKKKGGPTMYSHSQRIDMFPAQTLQLLSSVLRVVGTMSICFSKVSFARSIAKYQNGKAFGIFESIM